MQNHQTPNATAAALAAAAAAAGLNTNNLATTTNNIPNLPPAFWPYASAAGLHVGDAQAAAAAAIQLALAQQARPPLFGWDQMAIMAAMQNNFLQQRQQQQQHHHQQQQNNANLNQSNAVAAAAAAAAASLANTTNLPTNLGDLPPAFWSYAANLQAAGALGALPPSIATQLNTQQQQLLQQRNLSPPTQQHQHQHQHQHQQHSNSSLPSSLANHLHHLNNSLLTTVSQSSNNSSPAASASSSSLLTNQHQDSLVDQHFRRALGEDFNQIMANNTDKINVGK